MLRAALLCLAVSAMSVPLAPGARAQAFDAAAAGDRLAAVLRAGRNVVSSHQPLINDPDKGDKGLDGDQVVQETVALYEESTGAPPIADDAPEKARRLTEAQIEAIREVVDEHKAEIDMKGVGFKGFIPAVFGRLVNERFAEKVGAEARVKVTAPDDLVRNRKARPDAWERAVIEEKFRGGDWPRGQIFTEEVEVEGRDAFRMLYPEYYSASCLACHGGPAGEVDVTGYPKEGGAEGDLAGAISITLFR